MPGGGRQAYELKRLVGGDAAAHPKQDLGHVDFLGRARAQLKRWSSACARATTGSGT